jgi:ferredoxin--NADP+ reductase
MKTTCEKLFVTTDDGSYGRKGFVSDVLEDILEGKSNPTLPRGEYSKGFPIRKYGEGEIIVYAIGPVPMMAKVAEVTKPYGVKTIVSLNPIMVDATGMCGSCRVTVGGQTKFGCVDGPEFDAQQVDFKELMGRLVFFKQEEECSNSKCPRK